MSREWKPGDVATIEGKTWFVIEVTANSRAAWGEGTHAIEANGNGLNVRYFSDKARPLVVIDPEDREQVERLARADWDRDMGPEDWTTLDAGQRGDLIDHMQAALRSLIAPPKPPEPTGLGAVVEDADGELWIRWEIPNRHPHPWTVAGSIKPNRAYDDINAVRVLSEGVTR